MDKDIIIDTLLSKEKVSCKDSFIDNCISSILVEKNLSEQKILLPPQFTNEVIKQLGKEGLFRKIRIWSYSLVATAALLAVGFTFLSPSNKLPSDDLIMLAIQDEMIQNVKFALDSAQIAQLNSDIDTLTATLVEHYASF